MDYDRIGLAVRDRREELLNQAERERMLRDLESGRSSGIRNSAANAAQALSDALATVAQTLRRA